MPNPPIPLAGLGWLWSYPISPALLLVQPSCRLGKGEESRGEWEGPHAWPPTCLGRRMRGAASQRLCPAGVEKQGAQGARQAAPQTLYGGRAGRRRAFPHPGAASLSLARQGLFGTPVPSRVERPSLYPSPFTPLPLKIKKKRRKPSRSRYGTLSPSGPGRPQHR